MARLTPQLDSTAPPLLDGAPSPAEVRDLLSVREVLGARIRKKRAGIRGALQVLGDELAAALAQAPPSTVQVFFDANEGGSSNLDGLHTLSRDLPLPFFIVAAGVRQELPCSLRLHLRLQARRLEALAQALAFVEFQVEGFLQSTSNAAQR